MLFNSYEFLLAFLPLTLAGYFLIARSAGREGAILWLVLASLFFYGWWNPKYVTLIVASMAVNFTLGHVIGGRPRQDRTIRRLLVGLGVAFNLGLLGYYKYANFFVTTAAELTGSDVALAPIVLPLGISFFTFQQIAYLVDTYEGDTADYRFLHYALFVTFFPQLIAGPIVHHAEMMPQFLRNELARPRYRNIAIGLTILAFGLFKKAVLADGIAAYASPVFAAAQGGAEPSLFVAWGAALGYTLQLYFDFSGYSDMAIGSARLFGIRLPLNFFSPYKAASIVEFWRRWHMTLSRFLRDYLYIPLGGNRKGPARRYVNLMATMVLGGLWHGAGWTFVAWGALHGFYLIVNHAWRWLCRQSGLDAWRRFAAWQAGAWLITFLAVVVGWVFFRAASFDAAVSILRGMAGLNGVALPNALVARLPAELAELLREAGVGIYLGGGTDFVMTWLWLATLLPLALVAPNTAEVLRAYRPVVSRFEVGPGAAVQVMAGPVAALRWQPSLVWGVATAVVAGLGILTLSSISEFLYFQF